MTPAVLAFPHLCSYYIELQRGVYNINKEISRTAGNNIVVTAELREYFFLHFITLFHFNVRKR